MINYPSLAFLLLSGICFSQNISRDYNSMQEQLIFLGTEEKLDFEEMNGSSYLNENFQLGEIIIDNTVRQSAYLRYNALKDVVEIKAKAEQAEIFILPRVGKYSYEFKNYTLVLNNYITDDGEVLNGFVMKYYDKGNVILLGKSNAKITPSVKAETSYGKNMPAKINVLTNYYLGLDGDPVISIKLKRKNFKEIFDGPEMRNYFYENKIKNIEDVIEMLNFYNTQT